MFSLQQEDRQAGTQTSSFRFRERLKEIGMFFQGNDAVHQTMSRLTEELERSGITYALVGGMAVNAHRHRRTTDDVDILLTREGFVKFKQIFVPTTYQKVPRRPKRFVDPKSGVTFDVLVTGSFPGTGKPGPIAYPDPSEVSEVIDNIRVVDLPTLIQLKLAARRYYDFGDVVNLIRVHSLDESFQAKLHPSVQRDYIGCLEEKRREEEYEARQNEQSEEMLREGNYEAKEE